MQTITDQYYITFLTKENSTIIANKWALVYTISGFFLSFFCYFPNVNLFWKRLWTFVNWKIFYYFY